MSAALKLIPLRLSRRWLGFLLWSGVWLAVGLLFASLFNSLQAESGKYDQLLTTLPPAVMNSFNIAVGYLSRVENFLSGQFLTIYTLVGAIFGFFIGVGEVGAKIGDRTIVQWITKPISRTQLYLSQWVTNCLFLGLSGILVWGGMYGLFTWLTSQSDISRDYFLYGAVGSWMLFVTSATLGQLVGLVLSKNVAQGLGAGVLVLSWFLDNLSTIAGFPDWLKPFSLYHYFDKARLRDSFNMDWQNFWTLMAVTLLALIVGVIVFRRKDLRL